MRNYFFVLVSLAVGLTTACSGGPTASTPIPTPTALTAKIIEVTPDLPSGTRLSPGQSLRVSSVYSLTGTPSERVTVLFCLTMIPESFAGGTCSSHSAVISDMGSSYAVNLRYDSRGVPERTAHYVVTMMLKGDYLTRADLSIPTRDSPEVLDYNLKSWEIILPAQ